MKAGFAVVLGVALMFAALEASAGGKGGGRRGGGSHSSGSHHHHHHGGAVFFGGFWSGSHYYPGYYPYYPVPMYGPPDPYWYYCRAANAYYPYVRECAGGWDRYLPSPESPLG